MLKIFYCVSPLDVKLENFIDYPDIYFNMCHESKWILAEPFRDIISDVDNSDIIMDGVLYQREYGVHYPPEKLSGGTKMLLLMYHMNDESKTVFDLTACGENCAKWLPSISKDRDIVARIGYPMPIIPTPDWPVLCMNDNTIMTSEADFERMHMLYCNSNAEEVVFPEGYV